jgi:two-component system response regulator ChvI
MTHTIIIAEDNALIAEMVSDILSEEGYTVQVFGDGRAALNAVIEAPPALVLLDLDLPIMRGEQVLTYIREQLGADLPIIVMTAGRPQVTLHLEGATAFLAKPFGLPELLACVAKHIAPRV